MVMYLMNCKGIHSLKLNLLSRNEKFAIFHVYQGPKLLAKLMHNLPFRTQPVFFESQVPYKFQQSCRVATYPPQNSLTFP